MRQAPEVIGGLLRSGAGEGGEARVMFELAAMAAIAMVVLLLIDRAMRRAEHRILNEPDEPLTS